MMIRTIGDFLALQVQQPKATVTITNGSKIVTGTAASDVIDGGTGVATLVGNGGDDLFIVRNQGDTVTQTAGTHSTILSESGFALSANIENLVLMAGSSGYLTGNGLNNTIVAGGGTTRLDGVAGNDTLVGGSGIDTFVERAGEGSDTIVNFDIAKDVVELHKLSFGSLAAVQAAMTQSGTDTVLTLTNGQSLTFQNHSVGDFVARDFVFQEVTASPAPAPIPAPAPSPIPAPAPAPAPTSGTSASPTGPTLNDLLGMQAHLPGATVKIAAGATSVSGTTGADVIDGGFNVATLVGNGGTDVFIVRNQGDTVTQTAGTHSTILSESGFALSANIENLVIMAGSSGYLTGNGLNNTIVAGGGTTRLDGGAGNDTLVGGSGVDTFVERAGEGSDTIVNFDIAKDVVELHKFSFGSLGAVQAAMTQSGTDTVLTLTNGQSLTFRNHGVGDFVARDFVFQEVTASPAAAPSPIPAPAPAPNPAPTSGTSASLTGPTLNDLLGMQAHLPGATVKIAAGATSVSGTIGADVIDGGFNVATLVGNGGADVFIVRNQGDKVIQASVGTHSTILSDSGYTLADNVQNLVMSSATTGWLTGNALDNTIIAGGSTTRLDGLSGNDTLVGGNGADTFVERSGEGSDTIVRFDTAHDVVELHKFSFSSFNTIKAAMSQNGADVVLNLGGDQAVTFQNHLVSDFAASDFSLQEVASATTPAPTPAPAPAPAPAPSPAPAPAPAGSVLSAPQTLQPHNAGDIVGVHLQNASGQVQASHEVTFGQAFVAGDLPAGATLMALVNGQPIPVQMDVKTVNPDGSVKYAILTIEAPQLAAHGSVDVMLARGAAVAPKPAFDISSILHSGYSAELDLTLHNADGSTTPVALNVATLLQQAFQHGTANAWLSGPLSTEVRVEAPITGSLHARFDIRANADGTTSTDVIVLNDGTYIGPTNDYTYDATIKQNGQAVFSQNGLVQYHGSDWHELITSNGTVVTNVQQDVAYLEKTGLVPHYDTTTGVDQSAITLDLTKLASADTGPLGNALVEQLMPTVGGRHDLGIMTSWSADYLLTQDADAKTVMLANADAAGSVPWHFADEATGAPVRIDQHPNVNVYYAAQGSQTWGYGKDSVPGDVSGTGWIPDNAHQPDLTDFAYLTTGERYYLDEVQSQADWDLLHMPADYRDFASGNLMMHGELRAQAWDLRELADAALATPDSDPMKAYFTQTLQNNLDWMVKTYITDDVLHSAGALEGWLPGYPDEGLIAPWMEDYMAITLSQLAAEGFHGAKEMAAWMVNFEAGRFLNGDHGFDTLFGADYYYQVWDPNNPTSSPTLQALAVTGTPYSNWADVFQASNLSAEDASYVQNRYDAPDLYPAIARGALASLFDATGSEDALNAYGVVTTAMAKAGALPTYLENPQWDIAPQFSDGSTLHNSDIHIVIGSTGSAFSGVTSDQLIADIGTSSSTLTGGAGINVLLAGTGGDTLVGGANEDHLFGGTGNDRLIGGAGTNYLKGGGGADTFVFSTTDLAHDVVRDFDAARDHIEVHDPSLHLTASALAASVTADAHGDAVLHLAAGHDVVLQGIHASSVHTDWFLISA